MRWRALLVAVLGLTGCFDPKLGSNPFACGPGDVCPPGYSCHDGMCGTSAPAADAPLPVADAFQPDTPLPLPDAPKPDVPVSFPPDAPHPPDAPVSGPPDAPVSGPPDARRQPDAFICLPLEVLGNAGFDSSSGPFDARKIAPWVASRSTPPLVLNDGELSLLGVASDTHPFAAALGGENASEHTLYQIVVVPPGSAGLHLSGKTWIISQESSATSFDTLRVDLLDPEGTLLERLASFSEAETSNGWRSFTAAAASSHAGETVIFRMRATNGMMLPTTFFVDSLSLKATCLLTPLP